MDWIKKNLVLVISGAAAVVLLGFAGYFLYTKYSVSQSESTKLEEQETKLQTLTNQRPNPGNKKVDNIAAAKEHEQRLQEFAAKARQLFANVPYPTNLDSGSFRLLLDNTVDELQRLGREAGTKLPDNYAFTFAVQKPLVAIKANTITPLSRMLMEIRAITGILFDARILELDRIRRVSVPDEDSALAMGFGGSSDYWTRKPSTNNLAVVVPYEFTFRCFSSELEKVLEDLAASPHSFLVKNLTVDSGDTNATDMFDPGAGGGEGESTMPRMSPQMMMMMRYGIRPGMRAMPPPPAEGDASQPPTDASRIVGEKPFRVSAWVDVVRILEPGEAQATPGTRPRRDLGAPGEAPADTAVGAIPTAAAGTDGTN